MSSYMDRIKICVLTALRNSPCTFEEVIRKCAGVYPILVKEALDELKRSQFTGSLIYHSRRFCTIRHKCCHRLSSNQFGYLSD